MYRKTKSKLEAWRQSPLRKPLILRGARQVGKTYILKEWGREAFKKVHYVNFEANAAAGRIFEKDFHIPRILNELGFLLQTTITPGNEDVLIFDEIQAAPKALTALKYFCEDCPQLALCAAGSLLGVILSEESFPVGKVNFLSMYPLTFDEFLRAVDEKESWRQIPSPSLTAEIPRIVHDHLWELTKLYYAVGGMPEAVQRFALLRHDLTTAFREVREVQQELLKGYEGDFTKHAGKLNAIHIQALYRSVAAQLAGYHNDTTKRFRFGEVMTGKKGFAAWERPLHWLVNADLVIDVRIANAAMLPLQHYTKANIFKLFMSDVGLLACAQGLDPSTLVLQDYGMAKGYFAENFVAQEMRASHDSLDYPLYAWNEGTAEIEFVRSYGSEVIPVEVKSGHRTKAKSLAQFCAQYHPSLNIKITALELSYDKDSGLLKLPLYLACWAAIV